MRRAIALLTGSALSRYQGTAGAPVWLATSRRTLAGPDAEAEWWETHELDGDARTKRSIDHRSLTAHPDEKASAGSCTWFVDPVAAAELVL